MIAGGADLALFEALNAFVARSWLFDSVIALALDNPVVKGGVPGACFVYAWYSRGDPATHARRRRTLAVTLLSLFLIAPASKLMSEAALSPRPYVMGEEIHLYRDGALERLEPIAVRAIQTGEISGRIEAVREGELASNDLGSFPSDHAALYFALALGIFLACRAAGVVAMAWALVVVFIPRIAVGLHWPLDIVAGAALGAAMLLALQLALAGLGKRRWESLVGWTDRHPGLAAALVFLLLIEAVSTMPTLDRGREIAMVLAGGEA